MIKVKRFEYFYYGFIFYLINLSILLVFSSLVVYSFLNRCLSSSGSSPNVLYNSFNVLEIFNSWRSNLFNVVVPLSRKEYKWLKLKDWGSSFTVLFSSKIDGTRETLLIF